MTLPCLVPLDLETLRAEGVPEHFAFGHADRVRFYELDVLDHVNNARYLSWFEAFRIAWMRAYGLDRNGQPSLVLKAISVDFRAPLHLDETYIVAGRAKAYRRTSWTMEYAVVARGRVCATSEAVVVLMETDGTIRRPLPDRFLDVFRTRDGATPDG